MNYSNVLFLWIVCVRSKLMRSLLFEPLLIKHLYLVSSSSPSESYMKHCFHQSFSQIRIDILWTSFKILWKYLTWYQLAARNFTLNISLIQVSTSVEGHCVSSNCRCSWISILENIFISFSHLTLQSCVHPWLSQWTL